MKYLIYLLFPILFFGCVSKKKYIQLLNEKCNLEVELLLHEFDNNVAYDNLENWEKLTKNCNSNTEGYYLLGARTYQQQYEESNYDSQSKYFDSTKNYFKTGIKKLDKAPLLKYKYAIFLDRHYFISRFDFYDLFREALYYHSAELDTLAISKYVDIMIDFGEKWLVPKEKLTLDYEMITGYLKEKDKYKPYSNRLKNSRYLFLSCSDLKYEMVNLFQDSLSPIAFISQFYEEFNERDCIYDTLLDSISYQLRLWEWEQDKIAPTTIKVETIFRMVASSPSYPGGEFRMNKYFKDNLKYPLESKKNKTEGTVYVEFTVEKNGSLSNIKIKRGVDYFCNKEAIRIVKSMEYWVPGTLRGKRVQSEFVIPIQFKLD